MIRGTTAQFKFKVPYPKNELQWVTMKFWQPGNNGTLEAPLPIIKKKTHCEGADDSTDLYVSLSADETLRFTSKFKARVQLRAQHNSGFVFASKEEVIPVYPISDDLVQDPIIPDGLDDGWIVLDGQEIIS